MEVTSYVGLTYQGTVAVVPVIFRQAYLLKTLQYCIDLGIRTASRQLNCP